MLLNLTVENYALIDHLEIMLDSKLNIITGETGAGKSILLGALGLLLGGKNDGAATKDNSKSCVVEGHFDISGLGLKGLFEEHDWEYEECVTLRRVITPSGKSRAFVGDIPVALSELKVLSNRLIDIHSQHQNLILADESFRISALDLIAGTKSDLDVYRSQFEALESLRRELHMAEDVAASARRDEEWVRYQVEELSAAKLRVGEVEEAEAELKVLENAELISETLDHFAQRMESDDERGVLIAVKSSEREMRAIGGSYPEAADYAIRIRSIYEELKDIYSSVSISQGSIEADPERLAKVSARIDAIYSLCQKHRARDLDELIEIRDKYSDQLSRIVNSDADIEALKKSITHSENECQKLAEAISKRRAVAAPQFESGIVSTLKRLGMEQARFFVDIKPTKTLTSSGCDSVNLLFTSVEGRSPQAVERVASGGEISRVMLALKVLLASRMNLPTIIFDEIDTGVSGRIADSMGEIIADLSQRMQVIDITHLPQVASKGESHFVVYKEGGHTHITSLTSDQRIEHIAMMISGSRVTDAALEQARQLLGC